MDLVISEGGHFRTLFFSSFWHIGKFGCGKKDQTPCRTAPATPGLLTIYKQNLHNLASYTFMAFSMLPSIEVTAAIQLARMITVDEH